LRALFERPFDDSKESVMLLLFGRFKGPARLGLGVVMVIIGIAIHQPILALVGAVLAVWGLYAAIGWLRNRDRKAGGAGGEGEESREDTPR
jgi:hypothetical protein